MKTKPSDFLIALDDGHGMNTSGKRTPQFTDGTVSKETGKNFMHENEFNRAVVKLLDMKLRKRGFKTLLVAPTDNDHSLGSRVREANEKKADIYVSVHANAMTGKWGNWKGIETFSIRSSQAGTSRYNNSKRLAKTLHKHIMKGTSFSDRGVKEAGFYVLRYTNMPSALVECGFMDNEREAKLLLTGKYREETAEELYVGICEYFGISPKEEEKVVYDYHFKDVDINGSHSWAREALDFCVKEDIIKGHSDGTFRPNEPVTRLQMAVLIYRVVKFILKQL